MTERSELEDKMRIAELEKEVERLHDANAYFRRRSEHDRERIRAILEQV